MKQLIFYSYKNGRREVELDGKKYNAVKKQSGEIQSDSGNIPHWFAEWELTKSVVKVVGNTHTGETRYNQSIHPDGQIRGESFCCLCDSWYCKSPNNHK